MSLHDEILDIRGDEEDNSASYALGLCDAKQEAAALAMSADAEIARLQSQFDPEKFAHRPDCCGPDIDTHCLGCAMAESNKGDMEVAALTIKITRLTGENAVLRDLLRDALAVVCTIDGENDDEVASLYDLTVSMREAINGQYVDLVSEVSDGEIYEATSRRANPEAHAELDKLMDAASTTTSGAPT